MSECRELARDMSDDMARTWHAEWAKTYDADTYTLSDKAYAIFLGAFPDDPKFAESQYYRAELAWSRADREAKNPRLAVQLWDDAADRFVAVVDAGKVDRKLLEESARAAVLATVNARLADPRKPKLPTPDLTATPGAPPAPKPIPADDKKVLAAFDLYLASVKDTKNPERTDMIFYKADLLRRYPQARWHEWEPLSHDNEREGLRLAFGRPMRSHLSLTKAKVIAALDCDLFGDHPDALRLSRDFAATRNPESQDGMSRLYAVEQAALRHGLLHETTTSRAFVGPARFSVRVRRIEGHLVYSWPYG